MNHGLELYFRAHLLRGQLNDPPIDSGWEMSTDDSSFGIANSASLLLSLSFNWQLPVGQSQRSTTMVWSVVEEKNRWNIFIIGGNHGGGRDMLRIDKKTYFLITLHIFLERIFQLELLVTWCVSIKMGKKCRRNNEETFLLQFPSEHERKRVVVVVKCSAQQIGGQNFHWFLLTAFSSLHY